MKFISLFYLLLIYFGDNLYIMSTRINIDELRNILIKKGLEPLFITYSNSHEKLLVKCPIHGNFFTKGQLIKRGNGCRKCGRKTYAKTRRGSIEKVAQKAIELGFKLISTEFPSIYGFQKLNFECPIHGIFEKEHRSVMRGKGCPKCGHSNGGIKNTKSVDTFKKEMENSKYNVLEDYISSSTKLKVECPEHGVFMARPDGLLGGHGCPKCGNRSLKTQNAITNFISSFELQTIEDNRTIIKPLELDIYIPSKQLAVEYCGIYWHTEDMKDRNSHFNKWKRCNEKGIQLITIFSDEWLEKEKQVRNILQAKLNLLPKIAARKCQVKEITKKECDAFMEEYHLQGAARSSICFGLFYENQLVAAISGGPHHRQGQKDSFVLNRLCFGPFAIIGGSSKLFKAFKEKCMKLGFHEIISWSDNRWSNGQVYEKLGFILEEEMKIDYSYCKSKKRISKQSCQKKQLLKKGAVGNTEKEMAESIGYKRIWDCGKKRWTMNLTRP